MQITKIGDINFDKKYKKFLKEEKKILKEIAELSIDHFEEGFQRGGYMTDDSRGGWKRKKDGSKSYLKKTGKLSRSLRWRRRGLKGLDIYSSVPYGSYHNTGKGYLPKREFVGRSRSLNKKVTTLIRKRMNKIFKR